MKKILLGLLLGTIVLSLTACAEYPEGVDQEFHTRAMEIFEEVDDDTMELDIEGADADDLANISQMSVIADNEYEKEFSKALDKMVELQASVINGDRDALKQYLIARNDAMQAMNFGDNGEEDKFQVYQFKFGEEE